MVELYENKEIRTMGAVKGTKAPSNCLLGYKTEDDVFFLGVSQSSTPPWENGHCSLFTELGAVSPPPY